MKQKHNYYRAWKYILSGVFGGLLASLLILFLLVKIGFFPFMPVDHKVNFTYPEIAPASTVPTQAKKSDLIDKASKAIVSVINVQQQNIWTQGEDGNVGSGIIYKNDKHKAYIVTNNHVVKGAKEVEIIPQHDKRMKAKVLGKDDLSDLAVLEVDVNNVNKVAKLGKSENLYVGETVYAIGNPLGLEFSGTVTKGIVSGLDRSVQVDTSGQNRSPDWEMEVIQTDAAINPGNSGGALLNTEGEVVGINSMKIARSAVEGIGFAIPIDTALPIIEQLETNGEVTRPSLGIAAVSLHEVPIQYRQHISLPNNINNGVVIADVEENSPADKANLQQFDVITKINDQNIDSMIHLRKYLYTKISIGESITLEIYRNGKKTKHTIQLTE